MGNQKSSQSKEFDVEINHPNFSKSKIVTEGQYKRLRTNIAIDEKEYDKWKLSSSKYVSPPSNLLLPLDSSFKRTAMCGNTGNATLDYPNFSYLLTEEIYNRRGKKSRFTQVQLWYLLWGLVKARNQAEQAGQHLGDIRPRNVFLNEEGSIKVTNSLSWPLQTSNLQKAMEKVNTYLAPEDLQRLSRNQIFQTSNQVSQAFSIGLTVLSAGNLYDYQDLYDLHSCNFNVPRFNEALKTWRTNNSYSEVLRGTVSGLCQLDPPRRMTTNELVGLLQKHSQSIEQKVNFLVDNAPSKLHEEIMYSRKLYAPLLQNTQQAQQPYSNNAGQQAYSNHSIQQVYSNNNVNSSGQQGHQSYNAPVTSSKLVQSQQGHQSYNVPASQTYAGYPGQASAAQPQSPSKEPVSPTKEHTSNDGTGQEGSVSQSKKE